MRLFEIVAFHPERAGTYGHRRLWVEAGVACAIGADLALVPTFTRDGERYVLTLGIDAPGRSNIYLMPAETTLNLEVLAGLRVTPRVVEYADAGRPVRVLLDFFSVRRDVRFASQ